MGYQDPSGAELQAGKAVRLAAATAAVTNQFVVSTNMKVGAYTIANSGLMPTAGARKVTVTATAVTGNDTPGTILVTGTDLDGAVQTETIIPLQGSTVSGLKWFKTVTSVVGAGWVINTGNDTIVVGCGAEAAIKASTGVLKQLIIGTTAAGTIVVNDDTGVILTLKASYPEGAYKLDLECTGHIGLTLGAASDITVTYR